MAILNYLDVSTSHVTEADAALLTAHAGNGEIAPVRMVSSEYGWFVNVPDDKDRLAEVKEELRALGYSEAFINLFDYAKRHTCFWIVLDRDAGVEETLPVFDW